MKKIILVLLFLSIFIIGSSLASAATRNVYIIVKNSNGNLISGALVNYVGPGTSFSHTTNAEGKTTTRALEEGSWTFTASKTGYETKTISYTINPVSGTLALTIILSTTPTCTNECSSGQIGCNGLTGAWFCGEANDGDNCLDKRYGSCTAGYTCSNGVCTQSNTAQCSDSDDANGGGPADGDVTTTQAGSATRTGSPTMTDECYQDLSVDRLYEAYCSSSSAEPGRRIISCPTNKPVCSNGACIAAPPTSQCVDSDDVEPTSAPSSNSKYTKGNVDNPITGVSWDSCASANEVNEHYCASATEDTFDTLPCGSGYSCLDGACVEDDSNPLENPAGFPETISTFSLYDTSLMPEECHSNGAICLSGHRAEYRDTTSNKIFFVMLFDITRGTQAEYLSLITASMGGQLQTAYAGSNKLYRIEGHELLWFSDNDFPSVIITQEGSVEVIEDGSSYSYVQTATTNNVIINKLTSLYPSVEVISSPVTCTETDDGADYSIKGKVKFCNDNSCSYSTDKCQDSSTINEYYCSPEGNMVLVDNALCEFGCSDGACIQNGSIPADPATCTDLINKVKTPESFVENDVQFNLGLHDEEVVDWWINGDTYPATYYSATWYADHDGKYSDITYRVVVFDDPSINLESWAKDRLYHSICKIREYQEGNLVYICNWNSLNNKQSSDNHESKHRQVIWIKNNVLVEIETYTGDWLTDEEVIKRSQESVEDFLNDLQNNPYNYAEWEDFNIDYPLSMMVDESTSQCSSDIQWPVDEYGNTCSPTWQCKVEPVVCPPHGYQTNTCRNSCGEVKQETMYCNPGICSGCYVPRWLDKDSSYSDNICIPYGFRFEQDTGKYTQEFVEMTEEEALPEETSNDYILTIDSETTATLTLFDKKGNQYTYNLVEGSSVEISIPDWEEEISSLTLFVKDIVITPEKRYVLSEITWRGYRNVPVKVNAYCEIDGQVKIQKVKDSAGNWAQCQNNYECDSNLCSGGECVEINDAISKAKGFKSLFFRVFCRMANTFEEDNYNSCVGTYLGYEPTPEPTEPTGGGGGGGGGSNNGGGNGGGTRSNTQLPSDSASFSPILIKNN